MPTNQNETRIRIRTGGPRRAEQAADCIQERVATEHKDSGFKQQQYKGRTTTMATTIISTLDEGREGYSGVALRRGEKRGSSRASSARLFSGSSSDRHLETDEKIPAGGPQPPLFPGPACGVYLPALLDTARTCRSLTSTQPRRTQRHTRGLARDDRYVSCQCTKGRGGEGREQRGKGKRGELPARIYNRNKASQLPTATTTTHNEKGA